MDVNSQRSKQYEESVLRGREAMRSPAEKAGRELAATLIDMQNAFKEDPGRDPAEFEAARRRAITDSMRQTAPGIFSLADSVENAIVQGPSRAALQANDITTAQGAAELNRLLRGDDSAKNQDLVELQKQSKSLEELVNYARQNGAPPGIFD